MASVKYPLITNINSDYGTAFVKLERQDENSYILTISATRKSDDVTNETVKPINDERDAVRDYSQAIHRIKKTMQLNSVEIVISH